MSKPKNPFIQLERLPFSIMDRYLSALHLEERAEEVTGRPSRSTKQKVKSYHIEDNSSAHEVHESDSKSESNHSNKSDLECDPYSKSEEKGKRKRISKTGSSTSHVKEVPRVEDEVVSQEGRLECNICHALFTQEYDWNRHMSHHCELCGRLFSRVDSKARHAESSCSGLMMPHRCSICFRNYATLLELAAHLRRLHGIKVPWPEKEFNKKPKTSKVKELTEYEKEIQDNRNEKTAFLKSLKINEVKEGLSEAVKELRPKCIKRPPPPPRLKITRSSKVYFDLSEEAVADRGFSRVEETLQKPTNPKPIVVEEPPVLNFEDVLVSDQSFEHFINDFKNLNQGNTKTIYKWESKFPNLKPLNLQFGIGYSSLRTLDIHPMCEKTLIAGGGYKGYLYLWNLNSDSEPYAFQVHKNSISHLKFNPENPHSIVCTSAVGCLRVGDLVANVFKKVTKDTNCSYFDFLSPDTYLVGHTNGYISVVDMRANKNAIRKSQVVHQCHDFTVRSVSVHPVNKNEFIIPTHNGCVTLWDLRKLENQPVKEFSYTQQNILHSAIFSPLTGRSILTSSDSGEICLFDNFYESKEMSCMTLERSKLSLATWQPKTDINFAVGSGTFRAEIEIYSKRKKIFSYFHERLKSAIYCCAFHPSLPIIAAIQKSKVCVFSGKEP